MAETGGHTVTVRGTISVVRYLRRVGRTIELLNDETEAKMACVKGSSSLLKARVRGRRGGLLMALISLLCIVGCSDNVRLPTADQIAAFEAADPIIPPVDMERINRARLHTGPYRVVSGDVLEFTMPALLRAITEAEIRSARGQNGKDEPFICRVSDEGTITLPAAGELDAAGKSLAEIEADVIKAYASYTVNRPSIYVRILEYRTSKVYIAGAVEKPGVYTLRADQMTLVSLLTEAGGISAAGAAVVRVIGPGARADTVLKDAARRWQGKASAGTITAPPSRSARPSRDAVPARPAPTILSTPSWGSAFMAASPPTPRISSHKSDEAMPSPPAPQAADIDEVGDSSDPQPEPAASTDAPASDGTPDPEEKREDGTIVLPVVGMNVPFKDVSLAEGDTVVVEPVQMPLITVLGLVRNPGNFEYPPHARYNLAQVIALAGGLDMDVDPRYATIYRLKPDGVILRLAFKLIEDAQYTDRLNVSVRPGDLVAIEQTPRTRTNAFVNKVVRLSVGTWIDLGSMWDNN
jgi:protein involved in polysaccharide export with SLBB domain